MPTMVPYMSSSDPRVVIKFLCSGCNWVYYIKNPKLGKVDQEEYKKAVSWYEKHRCSEFPRTPKNGEAPKFSMPV
jgi:hypothetical protein